MLGSWFCFSKGLQSHKLKSTHLGFLSIRIFMTWLDIFNENYIKIYYHRLNTEEWSHISITVPFLSHSYVHKKGSMVYQSHERNKKKTFFKIDYINNLYRLSPFQNCFWCENTFKIDIEGNKRIWRSEKPKVTNWACFEQRASVFAIQSYT